MNNAFSLGTLTPHQKLGLENQSCKSLYIGNLDAKVNEALLYQICSTIGPVESCKMIKDKNGESSGYGFVEYVDHQIASQALISLNGVKIYSNEIRVNWANASANDSTPLTHIFVGDLSSDVDDAALLKAFSLFGAVDARVMWDQVTGRSRGYGFVAFKRKEEAEKALTEMNGEFLGNRAIRCNWANNKTSTPTPITPANAPTDPNSLANVLSQTSPTNTTVYIGNLTSEITEEFVKNIFEEYGVIEEIRVHKDKSFGFIRFTSHESAGRAICAMNGRNLGSKPIKCSWGKERGPTTPTQPQMPAYNAYGYQGYPSSAYPAYPYYPSYESSAQGYYGYNYQ